MGAACTLIENATFCIYAPPNNHGSHPSLASYYFMSEVSIFVVVDGLPYQLYLLENINGEIIGTIFSMGKTSEGLILQSVLSVF